MADWRLPPSCSGKTYTPGGVTITCHANANTKGSWTQCIASTACQGYCVLTFTGAALNYAYLVDLGIGAGGSEVVIAENLNYEWPTGNAYGIVIGPAPVPIVIAKGTRVAVRGQCSTAGSKVFLVSIQFIPVIDFGWSPVYGLMQTYGANTADSGGTSIDPGASASTWGAWTQFSASCTRNIRGIMIGTTGQLNAARADAYMYWQVGVGGAGSESSIIQHAGRQHPNTNMITPEFSEIHPVSIPAGTRIAVRGWSGTSDATDRLSDVILYAFS